MEMEITYGRVLHDARKKRGLTLDQLARKAGTKKGYVSGIERGKVNPPSARHTKKFCKALGLPLDLMFLLAAVEKIKPLETQKTVIRALHKSGELQRLESDAIINDHVQQTGNEASSRLPRPD